MYSECEFSLRFLYFFQFHVFLKQDWFHVAQAGSDLLCWQGWAWTSDPLASLPPKNGSSCVHLRAQFMCYWGFMGGRQALCWRAMSQTPERWLSFLLPRVDMQTLPPPFVGKVSFLQCLLWQLCWQAGGCSCLSSFLGYPSMPRLLNIFQSWSCFPWELYDPRYIAVMAILVNLTIRNGGHTCDLDLKAERQHTFILHLEAGQ